MTRPDVVVVGSGPTGSPRRSRWRAPVWASWSWRRSRPSAGARGRWTSGWPTGSPTTSAPRCTRWRGRRRSSGRSTWPRAVSSCWCPRCRTRSRCRAAGPGSRSGTWSARSDGLGVDGPAWRSLVGGGRGPDGAAWRSATSGGPGGRPAAPRCAFGLGGARAGHAGVGPAVPSTTSPRRCSPASPRTRSPRCRRSPPPGTALLLAALAHAEGGWPIPRGGLGRDRRGAAGGPRGPRRHRSAPTTGCAGAPTCRPRTLRLRHHAADARRRARRPAARRGRGGALEAFRYGNAAAKVDFVLAGPVPWTVPEVGLAGTVHVGGTRAEMAPRGGRGRPRRARRPADDAGQRPDRGRRDPRWSDGRRPLWTYAHVPAGSDVDVTEAVTRHIERFAPGFRDVVVDVPVHARRRG